MPDRIAAAARALVRATPASSKRSAGIRGGTVVARGINYGTAFEIALKIRELSGLLFEAWSAADLMHGPVAAIAPGWPVIASRRRARRSRAWRRIEALAPAARA